ncbi:MAG TPA: GntR family transcriptional regulator [Pyrinomonadaceae bacterium]
MFSIKNSPLSEQAYKTLLDAIFNGSFFPGEPLRELHLAQELEISQTSVREALTKLEHVGLVVRVPNKGTFVTELSKKEIEERITLRGTLEEIAGVEALKRITPAALADLNLKLGNIIRAVSINSYFEVAQADLEFHRLIWKISGNKTLYEMLDQLTVPLFAFISILRRFEKESLDGAIESHREIIEAFGSGVDGRVREVIRQHSSPIYINFLNSETENLQALARKTLLRK